MFFRTPTDPPKPPEPETSEEEAARAMLANGMLLIRESLAPAFDVADGMRADLIARGWSPGAAELLTMTWLQRVVINCTPLIGESK